MKGGGAYATGMRLDSRVAGGAGEPAPAFPTYTAWCRYLMPYEEGWKYPGNPIFDPEDS